MSDGVQEAVAKGKQAAEKSAASKRSGEFFLWVFAPLAILFAGFLIATGLQASAKITMTVIALVVAGAGVYFLFKPSKNVGRARGAGLAYAGCFAMLVAANSGDSGSGAATTAESAKPAAAVQKLTQAERDAQELERQKAAEAEAAGKRTEYVARLEKELKGTTAATFLDNANSPEQITVSLAVFLALASEYEDGDVLNLSSEQQAVRQRFKARIIDLQVQTLPTLRSRYGKAMAEKMWENNMKVRALGTANRTIEFVWGGFASNKNIAEFHRTASENFEALRFKRAQYKWIPSADEYTYYTLETPNDRDLVISRGGSLVKLVDKTPPPAAKPEKVAAPEALSAAPDVPALVKE